jgi:hypothetical protein
LEEDELELLPELELEPHAASPSEAATANTAVLVRMSFVCISGSSPRRMPAVFPTRNRDVKKL